MLNITLVVASTTAADIYAILLDSDKHSALIGDEAQIDPSVGGECSAFSGYATGQITKLVPNKLIEQTWRASDWPEGHYSTICYELADTPDGAQIHFTQTNLPKGTEAEFEAGWEENYWTPLTNYFA